MRGDAVRNRSAESFQERAAALTGLPLRGASAWAILRRHDPSLASDAPAAAERLEADPGWVARRLIQSSDAPSDLSIVASSPWWQPGSPAEREAVERLWRHSAAVAWTARNLAFHRGTGDPRQVAWLALLSPLGAWVMAAAAPARLSEWLAIADPETRRHWERETLGDEIGWIGRNLGVRWRLPRVLTESVWLLDESGDFPCDLEPAGIDTLALLRHARDWVNRTPFRLFAQPSDSSPTDSIDVKQWMAGFQSWLPLGMFEPAATAGEERACRAHARLLADLQDQSRDGGRSQQVLEAVAATRPGQTPDEWLVLVAETTDSESPSVHPTLLAIQNGLPDRAAEAVRLLLEENVRLGQSLRHAVRAARPRLLEGGRRQHQELLDALADFAAGAGHELNNPLAVVMGRAQLLMSRLPENIEAQRSLRTIIAQAQRAHRMLRDLMYVARPSPDRLRLCQPEDVVRRGVDDLRPEAESRKIQLEFVASPAAPAALCDADQLRHVIEILLRNAIDTTPSDGAIQVETERAGESFVLRVADQGPGLDPDESRHVLLPFYSGRHAGRGLGLGLPRIARYLDAVGGQLHWTARPGGGTIFRVDLPLAKELPRAAC